MGPGTYFLRVIQEGGRGDNMRNIPSSMPGNIPQRTPESVHNNRPDVDPADLPRALSHTESADSDVKQDGKQEKVGKEKEGKQEKHDDDDSGTAEGEGSREEGGSKRAAFSLLEPQHIRRVIFCSGKVRKSSPRLCAC